LLTFGQSKTIFSNTGIAKLLEDVTKLLEVIYLIPHGSEPHRLNQTTATVFIHSMVFLEYFSCQHRRLKICYV